MSYTHKIRGDVRPVNTFNIHTLTPHLQTALPVVRDPGGGGYSPTAPPDDAPDGTPHGLRLPDADDRARRLADAAFDWLEFASERTRMRSHTITRKALASLAFALQHGAHDLAIPTKLVKVKPQARQQALWRIVRARVGLGTALEVERDTDAVRALYDGVTLGELQSKHLGWVRPLLPFGARLYVLRVTGHETEGYTLGLNVCVGHVGRALAGLRTALGEAEPDEAKRAATGKDIPELAPASSGDGATGSRPHGHLRLVAPPVEADDVVLHRDPDGTAHASVPHVVRHSPTGVRWGGRGAGCADLALSVLSAFARDEDAERLYGIFADEVVTWIPYRGGVLRAERVRAWLRRHGADPVR